MKKILIAIPTYENISPETFKSVYDLDKGDNLVFFEFVKGYDCARARNNIIGKARQLDVDYVLMVDSDVILDRETLVKLLESPYDVTFGCTPRKNTKCHEVELFKPKEGDFTDRYTFDELDDQELFFPVKGGGMGCVLIKMDIIRKLPFPWFQFISYKNGSVLSEDLYFCHIVPQVGGTVGCRKDVRNGHLARYFQFD